MIFLYFNKIEMQGLKKKFIDLRVNKALKNQTPRSHTLSGNSHRIGVLLKAKDQESLENSLCFINAFKEQHKEVQVLVYGNEDLKLREDFLALTVHDFGFFGALRNEQIEQFLERDFDYFFCLEKNLDAVIRYILAFTKSKLRIGFHKLENEDFLELMIKGCESLEDFTDTILHYTQLLDYTETCVD